MDKIRLGGVLIKNLIKDHGLKYNNLEVFLPIKPEELLSSKIEVHYLGYYLKWIPQETYYYAVENCDLDLDHLELKAHIVNIIALTIK